MKFIAIFLLTLEHQCALISAQTTESAIFDQRQSGHYNIHISIKDVAIIDLEGNDFEDNKPSFEDYYYDESDLTIKPISAWFTLKTTSTTKPTSTLSAINTSPIYVTPNTELTGNIITSESVSTTPSTESVGITPSSDANTTATPSSASTMPNLLHQADNKLNTTTVRSVQNRITKKPSLVVMNPASHSTSMPQKIRPIEFHVDSGGIIPVHIISEPSGFRQQQQRRTAIRPARFGNNAVASKASADHFSNHLRRNCRHGQIRDPNGNCRNRRSNFLGRLLGMIKLLSPHRE